MIHWWVLIPSNPAPAFFFLFPLLFCEISFPISEKESLRDLTRVGKRSKTREEGQTQPPPSKKRSPNKQWKICRTLSACVEFNGNFLLISFCRRRRRRNCTLAPAMDGFRDFVDDWRVRRLDEQSAVSPVRRSADELQQLSRALLAHNRCTKYK